MFVHDIIRKYGGASLKKNVSGGLKIFPYVRRNFTRINWTLQEKLRLILRR